MKTHVIQLDSNDDYISIRDKIGWVKAPRISHCLAGQWAD